MAAKSEGEIRRLLKKLKAAREKYAPERGSYIVWFCIDCGKTVKDMTHSNHHTTFSDYDHDGISEWIDALEWGLNEGKRA